MLRSLILRRIINMMDKKYFLAKKMLIGCRLSIVDATHLIKNILDAKPAGGKLTDAQFVLKVIEVGLRNIRNTEKSFEDGFKIYLESKQHLRPDSIRDIRCIGNRLIRTTRRGQCCMAYLNSPSAASGATRIR